MLYTDIVCTTQSATLCILGMEDIHCFRCRLAHQHQLNVGKVEIVLHCQTCWSLRFCFLLTYTEGLITMATEAREDFEYGSSKIEDYFKWMDARHRIYLARQAGQPKPWTDDPILRDYKFTNVFRELDKGTLALRAMEKQAVQTYMADDTYQEGRDQLAPLILFNTWWYRIWNWFEHGPACGFVTYEGLRKYMRLLDATGGRMWTNAHMIRGSGGQRKIDTYLRMMENVWNNRADLTRRVLEHGTLQAAFNVVLETPLIGDFTAYEIVSDLRWNLLVNATDKYTWGNPGNGAIRGMNRLGLEPTVETMRWLWLSAPQMFERIGSTLAHFHFPCDVTTQCAGADQIDYFIHEDKLIKRSHPPFEIREVEHCLCEFDKYERARLGQGTPRSKYNGSH